jgi:aminobenzoyl-glutamate transport protein
MAKRSGFLTAVERAGNALPHPGTLFAALAALVLALSWLGASLGWTARNPATGADVQVVNLLSRDGLHRILLHMVDNYTSFAPLGIVMVAMLGIGIAESSGLLGCAIRMFVIRSPRKIITFVVVLAGVLSNVASDLGYVLIIPMAGIIFHSLGRHPVAGMAAAFAGVSGGFSANLLIGTIDPLLAGLSTEAARIIDPAYRVLPTANYYFMVVSAILIAFLGTWVTNWYVEPRLGRYTGDQVPEKLEPPTPAERKGLRRVLFVLLGWVVLFIAGLYPGDGFLRSRDGSLLHSPLLEGFIAVLFLAAASLGIAFGAATGRFRSDADVMKGMGESFKSLASFLVLVFFASQFVAFFKWSHLGLVMAVRGADLLHAANLGTIPLIILFVVLSGFINLFMGSASAKWAILGPVFIPMFMLLGYTPELSQAIFRIGDSVTNVVSPMMSFFALIIVYFEKYDKKSGIGTLISTMLPYSITFFVGWTLLMIAWVLAGLPLGPGAGVYLG